MVHANINSYTMWSSNPNVTSHIQHTFICPDNDFFRLVCEIISMPFFKCYIVVLLAGALFYRTQGLMVAASPCTLTVTLLAYATAISSCAKNVLPFLIWDPIMWSSIQQYLFQKESSGSMGVVAKNSCPIMLLTIMTASLITFSRFVPLL